MIEAGKYLFRAANMWWRCLQYFVFPLVARDNICVYMAHVCFHIVVTVWGSVGSLLCSSPC